MRMPPAPFISLGRWYELRILWLSSEVFILLQVFPDMLDDYSGLRPLKGAAQLLAEYSDWPPLYDLKQLANNTVKVTAAS
jgi:hypothetical protein